MTFTFHYGLYRFSRMPFSLKTAPSASLGTKNIILSMAKWQFALVYIDDIFITSRSVEEHLNHLGPKLGLPSRASVTLNLEKRFFFEDRIIYLGHVIQPGRHLISTKETDAIRVIQHPTNVTELKSFLSLCNAFRRFLTNLACKAALLNSKMEKFQPFHFGQLKETEIEALETLQPLFLSLLILSLARPNGRYALDDDGVTNK